MARFLFILQTIWLTFCALLLAKFCCYCAVASAHWYYLLKESPLIQTYYYLEPQLDFMVVDSGAIFFQFEVLIWNFYQESADKMPKNGIEGAVWFFLNCYFADKMPVNVIEGAASFFSIYILREQSAQHFGVFQTCLVHCANHNE